jgi:hypothetical protein
MLHRVALGLLFAGSLTLGFLACGDDPAGGPGTGSDAGTIDGYDGGGNVDSGPIIIQRLDETKQTGRIVRAESSDVPIEGATITIGSNAAVSGAGGTYEIVAPRNSRYRMSVTAPGFLKLIEQEWTVNAESFERGDTALLTTQSAGLIADLLSPPRDTAKGMILVRVSAVAPCDSEEGATVSVDPPGNARVAYFGGQLPDRSLKSVQKGAAFSALVYDVDPGVEVKVVVTSPRCQQVTPHETGGARYTNVQIVEAGDVLAYVRAFLRDPPDGGASDAGADADADAGP